MTVHFVLFLVSVKRRGLPRVTTGCCVFFPCYRYFTLVQYRSNLFFSLLLAATPCLLLNLETPSLFVTCTNL